MTKISNEIEEARWGGVGRGQEEIDHLIAEDEAGLEPIYGSDGHRISHWFTAFHEVYLIMKELMDIDDAKTATPHEPYMPIIGKPDKPSRRGRL